MSASARERYVLPMGLAWEEEALDPLVQPLALARMRRGARVGFLTDAFALDRDGARLDRRAPRPRQRRSRGRRGARRVPPDHAHGWVRGCSRRADPALLRRAVQQLAGARRPAGAQDRPPRRRRHPSRGRNDAPPDGARLRQHRAALWRGGAGGRRRHAAHARPGAGFRAQPGRWLDLDARLPRPQRRGARGHRRDRWRGR